MLHIHIMVNYNISTIATVFSIDIISSLLIKVYPLGNCALTCDLVISSLPPTETAQ